MTRAAGAFPTPAERRPRFWNDVRARGLLAQLLFAAVVLILGVVAVLDLRANMAARGVPTDFAFLGQPAGFDVNQTLIAYGAGSTYGRAFLVGLLNTLLASAVALVLATVLGFLIGFARLSDNWIVARGALAYVELARNTPLLLQLLFWYNAVLKSLPSPRDSLALPFGAFLNNRGLFTPAPVFEPGAGLVGAACVLALALFFALRAVPPRWLAAPWRMGAHGAACAFALVLPLAAFAAADAPVAFDRPRLVGFNFAGGMRLTPEFVALTLGLGLYTAAFIAEVVRAGIEAVPRGQREAAEALGLTRAQARRLVVMPQATQLIVPLLTNQYLNLIKNSSLAVFIGYPDLVQVFAGTALNQTGAAVQIIFMTMAVYLAISLLASLAMNLYGRRHAPRER